LRLFVIRKYEFTMRETNPWCQSDDGML
jgi:hypothetical protein